MKIIPLEREIQAGILDYLRMRGHKAWRVNQQGIPTRDYAGNQVGFRPGPTRGMPDILGIQKGTGRFFGVEVKRPGKKPTADQLAFLDEIKTGGGMAIVATSLEDVSKFL